jgi:plasmid stabilization system protein ParE
VSGYEAHPEVADDLADIAEFIAEDNPAAVLRVVDEILDALANLASFPGMGHRRPDLTSRPLLFWRIYDYLIAYAPDERRLLVVAVLHCARNPRVMAAILRERE